jgi:Na+-transporting NADH:ubiquinone oxidoreductase subunit C
MTSIVALILAGMSTFLKPVHDKNEAIYNKKAILGALGDQIEGYKSITDEQVLDIFNNQVKQLVVDDQGDVLTKEEVEARGVKGGMAEFLDLKKEKKKADADRMYPVYIYTNDAGEKFYIVYARGKGLWDEIWGNIALEDDLNTIAGVSFDHVAETPGLGAEIKDNVAWFTQFEGKKIFDEAGNFKSVYVRKGGAKDDTYEVDGISGATITANGVSAMLENDLGDYQSYFNTIKKG